MKPFELPARLQTILDLLNPCQTLADIGTDHAYIPLYAVAQGLVERAYGCDINPDPLKDAALNVQRSGLSAQVELCLADGLVALKEKAVDALVLAGMNGELMLRLLSASPQELAQVEQVIVQPNQGIYLVRRHLQQQGFHLKAEKMIRVKERFFITCRFEKGSGLDPAYQSAEVTEDDALHLGPCLIRERNLVALSYFKEQKARHQRWLKHNPDEHQPALERVQRVLKLF